MQKFVGLIAVVLLLSPLTADAAVKKVARTAARTVAKVDYNCNDFKTQKEAQDLFLKMGGLQHDIYRLDADKDGIACEDLLKK